MPHSKKHSLVRTLLRENEHALVIYARTWNEFFAEDMVQDAFVKLLQEEPFPENPRAWLYRVVRNRGLDLHRKSRHEREFAAEKKFGNWFVSNPNHATGYLSAEDATVALAGIPQETREIIVAKIWGGLNFREISELTGRPLSSVHLDYHNGIEKLRQILDRR